MLVVSQAIGCGYSAVDGGGKDPWPWTQTVWTPVLALPPTTHMLLKSY